MASTLCKYDLRKGDLFVLSWERVRRVALKCIPHVLPQFSSNIGLFAELFGLVYFKYICRSNNHLQKVLL